MLLLLQFAIATATDKLGKKNPLLNAKLLITYPQFPWLCIVFFVLFFFNPSNFNPGCLCSTCLHKHMSAIWILQIKFTQWITQDYCWCGFFCSFVCFFFLLVERDAVILVESTKHSDNISSMHSGASIGKLLP